MKLIHLVVTAITLTAATYAFADTAGTIRFGLEAQYPPFEYKGTDGTLKGFDIDVGNAVCAAARIKCKWVENSFDGLIPALEARKFDAINSSMHVTNERLQVIDFSDLIYSNADRLIARSDSGLQSSVESLQGKRVGVLQGSTQEMYAKTRWAPYGVTVVSYQDQNQVYNDLATTRIDATLVSAPAGQDGFLSKPDGHGFAFVGKPLIDPKILGFGVAFGLRKGDTQLKSSLNAAIAKIKGDGTLRALIQKYFPNDEVLIK